MLISKVPVGDNKVKLTKVTGDTVRQVCNLSVRDDQKKFVAPNSISIAQAYFSKYAWFRAIYYNKNPIGFVMLEDQPDKPEYYLWRFMIDSQYQKNGLGRRATKLIIEHVKTLPNAAELLTSVIQAERGPQVFYEKQGFELTGENVAGEAIMRFLL